MSVKTGRGALVSAFVVAATVLLGPAVLFAPAAQASTSPSITLDQSAGTQAGSTTNLGMDLKFSDSLTDSPDVMTITLPPGLLANADVNGGACLTTTDLSDTKCQVGTGTVTADAIVDISLGNINLVPLTVDVTFDLVPPPQPGDLAGLAVNMDDTQIGQTAGIKVRPSGDPSGVGITLDFMLPNQLDGAPIEITEINSTFDGLRYPTTCPSTPANVGVSVDSYQDTAVHSVSAPLKVTGCSSLPYAPKVSIKATKDKSDRQVALTASVSQAANESPNNKLALTFPGSALGVNLAAIKLLCGNVSSGTCTPVGTVTAVSPFYPKPLIAQAYLTGTALGPTLTLVFPPPFPLTLVGTVTLTTKAAAFTGLPDIPLTNMTLSFNGGASGMFLTNCSPSGGTASGSSTDQNGDKTANASIKYTIGGCAASSSSSSGSGGGTGAGSAGTNSPPAIADPVATGLDSGHPSLSFRLASKKHAAKLTALTIKLPHGLAFVKHRVGRHLRITGVALTGARIKSLAISRGQLVIKLRRPAASVGVKLTSVLRESSAMTASQHSGKIGRLSLTIVALNTKHRSHTITKAIKLA